MTMTIATIESSSLPDRMEYAKALAQASIIPKAFQQRPADVLVAIEYGNALGIAPIVALSEINVIQGTPSLSASLMAALAREAGHKVRVSGDDKSATCTIVRKDDPDFEHTATWDEAKARAAGLWGKGHWGKDPGTMLQWRAISEAVRFACSEVLGGLRYTPEEVAEFTTSKPTVSQVKAEAPKAMTAAEVMAQPPTTPEGGGESDEADLMITAEQSAAIGRYMHALKLDKITILDFVERAIGHAVATSADLTTDEAAQVIEALDLWQHTGSDPTTGEVPEPAADAEHDPWAVQ
ncbi:hypothetical protein ACQCX2_07645 [Propionibacteriaceae bacterium Y1700]|uniref:hypothetical protein n=1 Tax=Microlunatus sp. Y1700 TaxID=3418487 RepID=UPI003DA6EA90